MNQLINLVSHIEQIKVSEKLLWFFSILVLLVIPFRIHMYNFAPPDDAKRHVAKSISGRTWPEILVMDEQFSELDHNEGWHRILSGIHRLGADREIMLMFGTIGLFLLFSILGLFLFQNAPWAWMLAFVLNFSFISPYRLLLGRPFLISATMFYFLLHIWTRDEMKDRTKILLTVFGLGVTGWIHGAWYLFALLPLGLLLARRVESAVYCGFAWLGGSLLAGLLNGRPILYLAGQVRQSIASVGSSPVTRLLVTEFQPSQDARIWLLLGVGFLLLKYNQIDLRIWTRNPAFWLTLVGWVLGLKNGRFWWDWGNVAFIYLMAVTFQALKDCVLHREIRPKLSHCMIGLAGLYFLFTADIGSRWSNQDFVDPLSLNDPAHEGWLPDSGGILYSDSMGVYYNTFFENPHGEWRYVLGHEPALMPPDLLAIYRQIQFYRHMGDHLYLPWVERMTLADRLVLIRSRSSEPELPQLEWYYAAFNTWVGRLPRDEKEKAEDQ